MRKGLIFFLCFILIFATVSSSFPANAQYTSSSLKDRTIEEIIQKYKEAPFDFDMYKSVEYDVEPSAKAPYNAGKVKAEYLQEALNCVNLIRFVAGLPGDIELDDTYVSYAQHGAVTLKAVDKLTHYPDKPSDMPQDFFNRGYTGTSSSNAGWGFSNIVKSLLAYMEDSDQYNIEMVGHRQWLLNPPMKKIGFGYYGDYTTTYVFDHSRVERIEYDYIAWPAKNYMPIDLIPAGNDSIYAWSVHLGDAYDMPSIDNVTVTLTRKNDGKVWKISKNSASSGGKTYFNVTNWGCLRKTIIFRPALGETETYREGDIYNVRITGLTKGGRPAEISYSVEFFRLFKPEPVKAGLDEGTYFNSATVSFSCDTPGARIIYTTDGSDPRVRGYVYREPVKITESTTFKVVATRYNSYSEVSTFSYKIEPVSDWAEADIKKALSAQLVPPALQGKYKENTTRSDFCKLAVNLLVRVMGKPLNEILKEKGVTVREDSFSDTSDYEILAANALGIVKGIGNGLFNPNGMITRQEAAVMLTRTANVMGINKPNASPETFVDSNQFAAWAKDGIIFVSSLLDSKTGKKVMGGVGNNRFSPLESYTREQSIITMLRLYNVAQSR